MNPNSRMNIFAKNHSTGHQPVLRTLCPISDSGHGAIQPPRNSVVANAETITMLTYSARKNIANFIELYSVWKPPTSSDSASGRSNGARLVSPTADTKYTAKLGISRIAYQLGAWRCNGPRFHIPPPWPDWASTICEVDIEPAVMNTATMDSPIATSYEIICAEDRSPPRIGYVEPDAQPASTTPYTPIEEHASTSSTA